MKRFAFTALFAMGFMMSGLTAQEIQKRKENQQDRIAQGVKSGQLTAGETARLDRAATPPDPRRSERRSPRAIRSWCCFG